MTLARFERRWAAAAMGAIFPGSRAVGLAGIDAMDLDGFLRELMGHLPRRAAVGVRLAVWIAALAPWFVIGRLTTIARLGVPERVMVLAALLASERYAIRSLALLLKALGALLYVADDGVRARMTPRRLAPGPALLPLRVRVRRVRAV
jgi:hypothetical protein